MASTKFLLTRDINSYNGFGLPPANDRVTATLAQSTAESFTVPSNFEQWIAILSYTPGVEVWVAVNTTASIPAGGTFAANASTINPVGIFVEAGNTISCLTPNTTADVCISLYAIGSNS